MVPAPDQAQHQVRSPRACLPFPQLTRVFPLTVLSRAVNLFPQRNLQWVLGVLTMDAGLEFLEVRLKKEHTGSAEEIPAVIPAVKGRLNATRRRRLVALNAPAETSNVNSPSQQIAVCPLSSRFRF